MLNISYTKIDDFSWLKLNESLSKILNSNNYQIRAEKVRFKFFMILCKQKKMSEMGFIEVPTSNSMSTALLQQRRCG